MRLVVVDKGEGGRVEEVGGGIDEVGRGVEGVDWRSRRRGEE